MGDFPWHAMALSLPFPCESDAIAAAAGAIGAGADLSPKKRSIRYDPKIARLIDGLLIDGMYRVRLSISVCQVNQSVWFDCLARNPWTIMPSVRHPRLA